MFQRCNGEGIKCTVVDCIEFLELHNEKAKEMAIAVKCICDRTLDNRAKLVRHLDIHRGDARHLPDLSHKDTEILFPMGDQE